MKGVKIDPAKVEAITKMQLPDSVNELQGVYHLYHRQVPQRQDKNNIFSLVSLFVISTERLSFALQLMLRSSLFLKEYES